VADEVSEVSRRKTVLWVGIGLTVAAFAFAAWSGWSWVSSANDDGLAYAKARGEVLDAGTRQVAVLNTLDYHDVDGGIARWLDASTGGLRDQLAHTDDNTKNSVRQGATIATGKVLDAAVSELDTRAGTAKMLASVEITVAKDGVAPATKRNRFAVQLARTDGDWKLSALDQVPVATS
jgi:Mce-associated membrane protein